MTGPVYICAKEIAKRHNVSVRTVWRWAKQEGFPTAYKFSIKNTGFLLEDILRWEKNCGLPENDKNFRRSSPA